jgi:AcrR family transcriptional regulator
MVVTRAPSPSRRSERARLGILDAALALCREQGYAKLTIEAIAARAGVGKQTIYRWWPSKGAVVLDAFERVAATIPVRDSGDLVADLRAFIRQVVTLFSDDDFGPHLGALIGEAQHDPIVRDALLQRYLQPRRRPLVERLSAAQTAGQLPPGVDLDAVLEIIFGALYHRLLLRDRPLDRRYADFVTDTVLGGIQTRAAAHGRRR